MAWRTVFVNEHAKINYKMNDINIQTKEGGTRIPIDDIRVLILGNTRTVITSYAVNELQKKNVKIINCDEKGMPVGEFLSYCDNTKQNINIWKQFDWAENRKNLLWQKIVQTKIFNQHQALGEKVIANYGKLKEIGLEVKEADEDNREGQAARLYFPRIFDKDFVRSNDSLKANAHLNYGYSILLSAVSREIVAAGFLTQIGVHHQSQTNPFNLASDLMEPFRPYVDRIVKWQRDSPLTLEHKLNLVSVLNEEITMNSKRYELAQAVQKHVQECLKYLCSDDSELPEMDFEL
ncbi:type II CRISPR-associated endonuclease Cas1 [Fructobacillus fructosus]|uniref:type II CRISPR-associated endonuclease Cas1 n=1 Tax=Fructobacillus fructosus TaxID=1631 RepID=UPI0002195A75|nr:type II CRISPR-associated endonuclease Cas1 [Fructobacillus fructosus]MBD9366533.1 type II CRISPR-associated endonuclease Cas1 [Leuconostoc mesenteroides]KRN52942.1 CRISPR-associated protein Cas1 [Fructobacillus fructosus KCTC 3544]MBC9119233.1 type II CRISPR-associated endonuclease Cas1 [Fructobacillus fructosus]CAK1249328.1 CRISPR-Cas system-associated integrase Cas1 (Cas1) [Fructobacillus fructosus]GAP01009.1 CRISPR-associated endonuclease Cas1 [Fructobacillus fructosus]